MKHSATPIGQEPKHCVGTIIVGLGLNLRQHSKIKENISGRPGNSPATSERIWSCIVPRKETHCVLLIAIRNSLKRWAAMPTIDFEHISPPIGWWIGT
jgi:hypothetical protein